MRRSSRSPVRRRILAAAATAAVALVPLGAVSAAAATPVSLTGGGTVLVGDARYTVSMNVRQSASGKLSGSCGLAGPRLAFSCQSITSIAVAGPQVTVKGSGVLANGQTRTFTAVVTDNPNGADQIAVDATGANVSGPLDTGGFVLR
ncbi:hypothetical protein [Actinomycetospora termitidis]|uniref:Neocarzinostatin family protein n=1 Tax=Actinomycetospora termitidis TaxID=3053470 RepID=A0ABT7MAU5_9PSEU|nr:hypothetical protein [Actinomycetospora sp. Odt1-22]MDL5157785.1 hypothetical protein [Actinomycetospora sp. Odt1-22]